MYNPSGTPNYVQIEEIQYTIRNASHAEHRYSIIC
jgi:hypothetical protein